MPPVERMCQARARCAIPPSSTSQAMTIATPMPAAGGTTIARMPARINRTLNAMAQPADSFAIPTRDDSAIFLLLMGVVLNVRLTRAPRLRFSDRSLVEGARPLALGRKTIYRMRGCSGMKTAVMAQFDYLRAKPLTVCAEAF